MIVMRATVRGALLRPVRPVVHGEFASANNTSARLVTTRASGYVRRAFGTYERGWRRRPTRYGSRTIVTDEAYNREVHASVHETGRRAGTRAGGVQNLMRWIVLRGADLTKGGKNGESRSGVRMSANRRAEIERWS